MMCFFISFFSCDVEHDLSNDIDETQAISIEESVINASSRSSDNFSSKDQIIALPLEEQKTYWLNRLESYQALDLNSEQTRILNDIQAKIQIQSSGIFYLTDELRLSAIEMAQNMAEEDFINLFVEFDNETQNLNLGDVCYTCINDLQSYETSDDTDDPPVSELRDCTCRWTCSQAALEPCSTVTKGCAATGGCGFLWMQACTGAIEDTGNC